MARHRRVGTVENKILFCWTEKSIKVTRRRFTNWTFHFFFRFDPSEGYFYLIAAFVHVQKISLLVSHRERIARLCPAE